MLNQLSTHEKLAVGVASIAPAALALAATLKLTVEQRYSNFIVGAVAWSADSKLPDLMAAPVAIGVLSLAAFLFASQLLRHRSRFGGAQSQALADQLISWSVPALVAVFGLVRSTRLEETLLSVSVIGIVFVVVTAACCKQTTAASDESSMVALSLLLIGIFPLELALFLGRTSATLSNHPTLSSYATAAYVGTAISVIIGIVATTIVPGLLSKALPALLSIGQITLPLLYLVLFPAVLLPTGAEPTRYDTTIWLKLLIFALIFGAMFDVVRRAGKHSSHTTLARLLSPLALFALLTVLKFGNTILPYISPDDYHFGESLLGSWTYLHGAIPYRDYIPAHGLIDDDLHHLMSYALFDGSAASVAEAGRTASTLLALAAFISIYLFSESIGLAFVATLFLGGRPTYFFLTPFLCLWLSARLRSKPTLWLGAWILTAPLAILGTPPQGILLVVASIPIAAHAIVQLWHYHEARTWTPLIASAAILLAFAIFSPLVPMLYGAVRYVSDNAPINQTAYGILWAHSWTDGQRSTFVFELIRMSWMATPIACLALIYSNAKNLYKREGICLPAIVVLAFVSLLIPYSMGRIDSGSISRAGLTAIFAWAVLLPIAAWHLVGPQTRIVLILAIACMGTMLDSVQVSSQSFVAAASGVAPTLPLRDGRSAGLPNVGTAYVEIEHWNRLVKLNAVLNRHLAPGEPYLDLTSRNAQYFYLNRRPVLRVTAPYNLVAVGEQRRAVKLLSKHLPSIALLEGANIVHDGGGLGLRNPYLYRFVMNNYSPQLEDGFIIGLSKTGIKAGPVLVATVAQQAPTETRAALLQKAFSNYDLLKLPVAWGRSETTLHERMVRVASLDGRSSGTQELSSEDGTLTVDSSHPFANFNLSDLDLAGRDAGLLRFDFACTDMQTEPRIQVFWWGDGQSGPFGASSVMFTAADGALIVPLDASARWLMLARVNGIRLGLANAAACRAFTLKNVGLFQRRFD